MDCAARHYPTRTRNGLAGTCWVCNIRVAPRAGWFEKQADRQYRVRHADCKFAAADAGAVDHARAAAIRRGIG